MRHAYKNDASRIQKRCVTHTKTMRHAYANAYHFYAELSKIGILTC